MLARLKPWMLPIAMLAGLLLYRYIEAVKFLSPYLIFVMLLITFCRISPRHLRFNGSMWWLLGVQLVGASLLWFAVSPLSVTTAQALFICVYCPTATAAPVITGMLGGSVERVALSSLLSNLMVAVTAPFILALVAADAEVGFFDTAWRIATMVIPMIVGPLLLAFALKLIVPKVHHTIATHQSLAFYVWAISLVIVVGNAVGIIVEQPHESLVEIIVIAALSLAVCLGQFALGRRIGQRYGDAVAGGQSLGQKNTVLGLWLAISYLHPLAAVGPAAYIAWHNIVNSRQIYQHRRTNSQSN